MTDRPPEDHPTPEPGGLDALSEEEREILQLCMEETQTDYGNGRRLLHRFGNDVLYVENIGWHIFDGRRWERDAQEIVIRPYAHRTAEAIRLEPAMIRPTRDEKALIDAVEPTQNALARLEAMEKDGADEKDKAVWKEEKKAYMEAIAEGRAAAKAVLARKSARYKYSNSSLNSSKISNMITEARSYVLYPQDALNADPLALNCESGTIRFVEDLDCPDPEAKRYRVRIDPHAREDLITLLAPVAPDPERLVSRLENLHLPRDAPAFDAFLHKVMPAREKRDFLQRICGYIATGLDVEQAVFFFYGIGRNGKSTFVDLIAHVLGDYATTIPIESLFPENQRSGSGPRPDLARLPYKRFLRTSEPKSGSLLDEAFVKRITSGEPIEAADKFKPMINFYPVFKLVVSLNELPRTDDSSDGFWRRVHVLHWDVQIPKDQVDKSLPEKLEGEAEAVFLWVLRGALDYLGMGLMPPESVTKATDDYREDSDPMGAFFRTCCKITGFDEDRETAKTLHEAYEAFAKDQGFYVFNPATFGRRLKNYAERDWEDAETGTAHRFVKRKVNGQMKYVGLRVLPEFLPFAYSQRETPDPS